MSITQTILIFVCIPLAVVLTVFGLVYGASAARGRRYRPGRAFGAAPVWYTAGGDSAAAAEVAQTHELTGAAEVADEGEKGAEWPEIRRTGETGGASDSW